MRKDEIEKTLDKVANYLLNHAPEKRRQLFLSKLSTEFIVRYIKEIPTPLLIQLGDEKLIDVAMVKITENRTLGDHSESATPRNHLESATLAISL